MPTFSEKNTEADLIAMGAKKASTDSEIQTLAISKLTPGALVGGGVTGQTSNPGSIAPTNTNYQALTAVKQDNPVTGFISSSLDPDSTNPNVLSSSAARAFQSHVLTDAEKKQELLAQQIGSLGAGINSTMGVPKTPNGPNQGGVVGGFQFSTLDPNTGVEDPRLKALADQVSNTPDMSAQFVRMQYQNVLNAIDTEKKAQPAAEAMANSQRGSTLSRTAANVRTENAGTPMGTSMMDTITQKQNNDQIEFNQKKADIIGQLNSATSRGFQGAAAETIKQISSLYSQYDQISQDQEKNKADATKQLKDINDLQKADVQEGGAINAFVKAGVSMTQDQFTAHDSMYGYQPGTSALLYTATKKVEDQAQKKTDQEYQAADLNIQKSIEDLADKPMDRQSKILDIQKKLADSKNQMYDTIKTISDALKGAPPGMVIPIGDASYFGLQGAGLAEKDPNGVVRVGGYDANGKYKQQNLGYMGDPADLETVYGTDGQPHVRNKRTGQEVPLTIGVGNAPTGGNWQNIVPDGSHGGQCGAATHIIVADYPYNLNTLEEKKTVINVPKGEAPRVGDVLIQDVGTADGHAATVNWTGQDSEGHPLIRLTESNWHGDEKWQNTRTMRADSPQVVGFFRGQLKAAFQTGSDSGFGSDTLGNAYYGPAGPNTLAETPVDNVQAAPKEFTAPSQNPFFTSAMTSAQMEKANSDWEQTKGLAQDMIDSPDKIEELTKGVPANIRNQAKRLATANGYKAESDYTANDLSSLNAQDTAIVKGIADYSIDPTKSTSIRTGDRERMVALAKLLDPTYDQTKFVQVVQAKKDFAPGGKDAMNIKSLNTAVGHLKDLQDAVDKLGNSDNVVQNKLGQWLSKNTTGNPAVRSFNIAKNAVAGEMATIFKNAGGTDQEITSWKDELDSSETSAELTVAVQSMAEKMQSRLDAIDGQYRSLFNTGVPGGILTPQSKDKLKAMGIELTDSASDPVIRVKTKDGTPGTIPTSEFDPAIYTKI